MLERLLIAMSETLIQRNIRRLHDDLKQSIPGTIISRNNTGVEKARGTAFFEECVRKDLSEEMACPDCEVHVRRETLSYYVIKCDYHGGQL